MYVFNSKKYSKQLLNAFVLAGFVFLSGCGGGGGGNGGSDNSGDQESESINLGEDTPSNSDAGLDQSDSNSLFNRRIKTITRDLDNNGVYESLETFFYNPDGTIDTIVHTYTDDGTPDSPVRALAKFGSFVEDRTTTAVYSVDGHLEFMEVLFPGNHQFPANSTEIRYEWSDAGKVTLWNVKFFYEGSLFGDVNYGPISYSNGLLASAYNPDVNELNRDLDFDYSSLFNVEIPNKNIEPINDLVDAALSEIDLSNLDLLGLDLSDFDLSDIDLGEALEEEVPVVSDSLTLEYDSNNVLQSDLWTTTSVLDSVTTQQQQTKQEYFWNNDGLITKIREFVPDLTSDYERTENYFYENNKLIKKVDYSTYISPKYRSSFNGSSSKNFSYTADGLHETTLFDINNDGTIEAKVLVEWENDICKPVILWAWRTFSNPVGGPSLHSKGDGYVTWGNCGNVD